VRGRLEGVLWGEALDGPGMRVWGEVESVMG